MRDRTMIMLALVFLVLTIGAGVNRAFESGSRMVGSPLGPGPRDLINEVVPRITNTAAESFGQVRDLAERGWAEGGAGFETLAETGREQFSEITAEIRARLQELVETADRMVAQKN